MPARDIAAAAQQLCDRYGGRVTLHAGASGVRVFDCPLWPAHATAWLQLLLPDSLIAVEPSAASLSGFIVVISRPPPALHRWPRIVAAVGVLGLVWAAAAVVTRLPHPHTDVLRGWWAMLEQACRRP